MNRFPTFLDDDADTVARKLLGCELVRELEGHEVRVRIVETEAYDQEDAASHSYRGKTPRTAVMFGESGYLYVYFTYGMHYCCNVVCGPGGIGSAVLVRAVEPIEGRDILEARRGRTGVEATNGPAKLCQALDIDRTMNGYDLHEVPLKLETGILYEEAAVLRTPRIGISRERDRLRRYVVRDSPYISR